MRPFKLSKNKFLYFSIFSIFLFFSFCIFNIFHLKQKDIEKYHKIVNKKSKLTSSKKFKRKPIFQKRTNVQKDIFILKDKNRIHFRIFSENSILNIKEVNNKIEIKEFLENIKCLMQDKIYFSKNKPFQKLKYFEAEKGTYFYPSHKFYTDDINLSFFEIEGKDLPKNVDSLIPYLKGFAKDVSFIKKDFFNLNAKHFRASFDPKGEFIK